MKAKKAVKSKSPSTIKKLASEIAKREGKKSQVSIGNIREILGHISDLFYEHSLKGKIVVLKTSPGFALYNNGVARAVNKQKK